MPAAEGFRHHRRRRERGRDRRRAINDVTSRIHRGFHRIGVVLAAPVLLVAGWLAGHEAWLSYKDEDLLAASVDPDLAAALASMSAPPHIADYTGGAIVAGIALALYVAARGVGWALAGFLRP